MKKIDKPQVIIVDDDPDHTYLIEEALKDCRPRPTTKVLHSGASLLNWLEMNQQPSLILLDINMPGTTGLDTLKILRGVERYKLIPVVMLSASEDERDMASSYNYGANSFISKPMIQSKLIRDMQFYSHYWFDAPIKPDPLRSTPNNLN